MGENLKVASFTVQGSTEQSARWKRAAEAEGYRSVGAWLGAAADAYLKARARAGLPLPLMWSRGRAQVSMQDGHTPYLSAWISQPFAIFRGDGAGAGDPGCKTYSLAYMPEKRIIATFRYARHCRELAAELASAVARGAAPLKP